MRDIRTMNMTTGQKIESDEVLKRIGDLSYRDLGIMANMTLFDSSVNKALIIGDGLRVESYSNMTINVTAGNAFQVISTGTIGGDVIPCIQTSDQTVTLDAADGTTRIDIIEAQIISMTNKDDIVQGASISGAGESSSIIVANLAVKRDIKYSLSVQKKKNTTITTAATQGSLLGTVDLSSDDIDLNATYLLNLADGEDGSFQEIDCRGADPLHTTRAEIVSKINTAVGRTIASINGNYLQLTGYGFGQTSMFTIKPPTTDVTKDVLQTIFGLSIAGTYKYTYSGNNAWFKLAEIDIGPATTVITTGLIRNIDQKDSWANEYDEILLLDNIYDSLSNANIGKIYNCDDNSISLSTWKNFQKMINFSINAGTVFSGQILSTYALVYTLSNAYSGGVLAPNGDIHFIPYSSKIGQKVNSSGVVSTYALAYTGGAYSGGVLNSNGDIHFIPYSATVGQKVNSSGVVSTYALIYTFDAYSGGVLDSNGDIHFIPLHATVGQKVDSSGVVSTYALVYTLSNAYLGGVLAPNGDIHFIPYSATVGQKVDSSGVVSTYALASTGPNYYAGGVLDSNGNIHMVPSSATVGQKVNSSGVVSTYALVYTAADAYYGGVLDSNGDIHFIPHYATVGQKVDSSGVVSTYALVYTSIAAYFGGVLDSNGNIHMVPCYATVGQKINGLSAVPFNKAMCLSSFFNKF